MVKHAKKGKKKQPAWLDAARAKLRREKSPSASGESQVADALMTLAVPDLEGLELDADPQVAIDFWVLAWNLPIMRAEARAGGVDGATALLRVDEMFAEESVRGELERRVAERCERFGHLTQAILDAKLLSDPAGGVRVEVNVAGEDPALVGRRLGPDGSVHAR